ncbi:uncharacterized protein [Ranitomeya imitator]|uniref:uncharacterized protein n=1 Tax=Ranitomeya imitator TaxID=111125 RepID=UPI0037E920F7
MWSAALQVEVPTISDPLSGDLLYKRILLSDATRMDRDRDKMAERILHLTLEILFRLTGEDYTVVKKTSSERCQAPVYERQGRPLSPITVPPPHPLTHEDINDQKILELTYKMIELLTGEVPIRCQDVTVYFSMEEWEYLEGHKDLYKDVMMEVPQPLTSPVQSSERTTPERCPRPLLLQDRKQEDPDVPQDHQGLVQYYFQGEDLAHINTTETYVRGDERGKEIPTDNRTAYQQLVERTLKAIAKYSDLDLSDDDFDVDADGIQDESSTDDDIQDYDKDQRPSTSKSSAKHNVWKKKSFDAVIPEDVVDDAVHERSAWSHMQYFSQYISDDLIKSSVVSTNQMSVSRAGKSLQTTFEEIKKFFGVSITTGCVG